MTRTRFTSMVAAVGASLVLGAVVSGPVGAAQLAGQMTSVGLPAGVVADRLAADPDGALWFTDPAGQRIGRRSTTGVVSLFAVDQGRPTDIEWGDDRIWFSTERGVGAIDPDTATVTEYPVAGGGTDIAVARDGDVWLTQDEAIVRMDTQGDMTEFAVPNAGVTPSAIVAGPDDTLWVTVAEGGRVVAVDDTGTFTTYPVGPGEQSGIALGSDKALWFAAGDRIDRITTAGAWTQGATAATRPGVLAAALDGNVWFASDSGVGRASSESARVFPAAASTGVTADPSGAVWAAAGDRLVRITTAVDPAVNPPRVSGTGHVGSHLMCEAPSWAFLPRSLAVQWYADGSALTNQRKVSLIPSAELLGRRITCRATAHFLGVPVPALAPASNSVTVLPQQGQTVAVPRKLAVAKSKRLPRTTRQAQPVSYRAVTPSRCRVKRAPVRLVGRRSGVCKLSATAPGSAQFTAMVITKRVVVTGHKKSDKRRATAG